MEPINYMLDVKNPIEEAMRGYGLGRADIEQRQVMDMRAAAEARAASEFEMRRAEAERQRAAAEAGQAELMRLAELGPNATTEDFTRAFLANPGIRQDLSSLKTMLEAPKLETMLRTSQDLYAAARMGNIDAVRNQLTVQLEAAKNSGDEGMAATYGSALEQLNTNPEMGLNAIAATSAFTMMELKGTEYVAGIDKALGVGQGGDNKEVFEREKQIRKEYTDLTKDYRTVAQAFDRVAASQDTGPGDIALIFNYMKMLDPGSTVREGEFSTAQNSGGIPTAIRNIYNQAVAGERLTAEQRASFKSQAEDLFAAAAKSEERARASLMPVIKQYGLDANQIFGAPSEAEEEAAAEIEATSTAAGDEAKATFMSNPAVVALAPGVQEMAWEIYQKQTGQ
jgi:hypothetical protein